MARLNIQRQKALEPNRVQFAVQAITTLGLPIVEQTHNTIRFIFKDQVVTYFPYSGWHTGKSITDGRGWKHLNDQLTKNK